MIDSDVAFGSVALGDFPLKTPWTDILAAYEDADAVKITYHDGHGISWTLQAVFRFWNKEQNGYDGHTIEPDSIKLLAYEEEDGTHRILVSSAH